MPTTTVVKLMMTMIMMVLAAAAAAVALLPAMQRIADLLAPHDVQSMQSPKPKARMRHHTSQDTWAGRSPASLLGPVFGPELKARGAAGVSLTRTVGACGEQGTMDSWFGLALLESRSL